MGGEGGGAGVCNYQYAKRHKVWISAIILNFHHTFLWGAMLSCLIEAMCVLVPVRADLVCVCLWKVLGEDMPGQRAR